MIGSIKQGGFKGASSAVLTAGVFGLALAGTTATAGLSNVEFAFSENATDGFFKAPNNVVGDLEFVDSTYNPDTQKFTWVAGYNQSPDGKLPEGFVLAVNDGPMPKHLTGYLAAFYFDATNPAAPVVSAYAYNGENSATSFDYGTFEWSQDPGTGEWSPPTDAPDPIASTLNPATAGFVTASSVSDSDARADRVFTLEIDAAYINAHSPLYPNTGPGYLGVAYDTGIGVWLHPFVDFDAQYNGDGYLDQWNFNRDTYGWFDFTEGTAEERDVPEPATILLVAAPLLAFARRRR